MIICPANYPAFYPVYVSTNPLAEVPALLTTVFSGHIIFSIQIKVLNLFQGDFLELHGTSFSYFVKFLKRGQFSITNSVSLHLSSLLSGSLSGSQPYNQSFVYER
jgi:hypothetical protein